MDAFLSRRLPAIPQGAGEMPLHEAHELSPAYKPARPGEGGSGLFNVRQAEPSSIR